MSYDADNFPPLPMNWGVMPVGDASDTATVRAKVQTQAYLTTGLLPVVDQGVGLVGGYTNDQSLTVETTLPVVIFGDHTRALKFVDFPFAAGADGIKILRPHSYWHPRLFLYFLRTVRVPNRGYSRHFQFLRESLLPVPPLAEQKRIADKLDALLGRIEGCRERLDRVPEILKRFRQSVLAAATSGELTREWRAERGLGSDWPLVELQDVCESIADGDHQAPPKAEHGIPFITIAAMNTGVLKLEEATRYVPDAYFKALRRERRAERGDVLFSVTGSIGIPALVDTDAPFVFQRHIAVLRPNPARITSVFLYHRLSADDIKGQGAAVATGTAQMTIPLGGLRAFSFRLPPLDEQDEISRRIDTLFAWVTKLELHYRTAATQVAHLTPCVLAKAFRGELVPQDPNDEPASELLARLRRGASSAPSTTKLKRGGTRGARTKPKVEDHMLTRKDVAHNHLSIILKEGGALTAEALWSASQLEIDDFYDQLKDEEARGLLRENRGDSPIATRLMESAA